MHFKGLFKGHNCKYRLDISESENLNLGQKKVGFNLVLHLDSRLFHLGLHLCTTSYCQHHYSFNITGLAQQYANCQRVSITC